MSALFTVLIILGVILFFIIIFLWSAFNDFVIKRNQVKTDFSDVAIQVKRKADLIDRLIEITKDYAKHEKDTFEGVAEARSALDTKGVGETAKAENMLSQTMRSLFSVVESNPKLKANENYLALRQDLTSTEDAIAKYREEYNMTVQGYNNSIQTFPPLLAARLFGFEPAELFQP